MSDYRTPEWHAEMDRLRDLAVSVAAAGSPRGSATASSPARAPVSAPIWFSVVMRHADMPEVREALRIEAAPDRLWPLITDITLPVGAAGELEGARWSDGTGPRVGAVFVGTNRNRYFGQWRTTSTVIACDEPRVFGWAVGDVDVPNTSWRFELEPDGTATVVTQTARLGIGESGITYAIRNQPDMEERIVARRLDDFRAAMRSNLERLQTLAESR